jgi:formylglycine-generating enzyme required for sulfatase activity
LWPEVGVTRFLVVFAACVLAGAACAGAKVIPGASTFRDCDVCPEMVQIPAGSFAMGSAMSERRSSEQPQHPVTISRAFAVGRFEVTFAEWGACVRDGGCTHDPDDGGWGRGRQPVILVSWNDARQYTQWLTHKTGKSYRLLSEAEWEYVARAGSTTAYTYGNFVWPEQVNYYTRKTAPVGSYAPNAFGLYDVHGNVWEWTEDCWNENYSGAPGNGAAWLSGDCARRVFRGGSWDDYPWFVRSAERSQGSTSTRLNDIGFRVARD